ncbi:hypothetical protein [Gorillibacterium sp. sgz5001074]|uniref:hypothetical protein n=1 Tax=Gorillibacterium sp. sgz5001074 TaxID=3446695 RepID=UPI003F666A12
MRRSGRWGAAAAVIVVACMMLILPLWQLADWHRTRAEQEDTLELLYQVADFQMELLGSTLGDAAQLKSVGQLNEWKQSAYAVGFVHDRLSQAVGNRDLPRLESVNALLQWIMRVQVGGDRTLRQEESELLKETAQRFRSMAETYAKLMDGGSIREGARSRLVQEDGELAALILKKLK